MPGSRANPVDLTVDGPPAATAPARTTRSRTQAGNSSTTTRTTITKRKESNSEEKDKLTKPARATAVPATRTRRTQPLVEPDSPTPGPSTAPTSLTSSRNEAPKTKPVVRRKPATTSLTEKSTKPIEPITAVRRTAKPASAAVSRSKAKTQDNSIDDLAVALENELKIEKNAPARTGRVVSGTKAAPARRIVSGTSAATKTRTSLENPAPPPQSQASAVKPPLPRTASLLPSLPKLIPLIPSTTLLSIPPLSLSTTDLQSTRLTINKCINSFRAAQEEGYKYVPKVAEPVNAGRTGARKALPTRTKLVSKDDKEEVVEKDRKWTDESVKEIVEECVVALRRLTGNLLGSYPPTSKAVSSHADAAETAPEAGDEEETGVMKENGIGKWVEDALAEIRLRMQIAKACSDFGFHANTLRILLEAREVVLRLNGVELSAVGAGALESVMFLPSGSIPLKDRDSKTVQGTFTWMIMLWSALASKAVQGKKEEILLLLHTMALPLNEGKVHVLEFANHVDLATGKTYFTHLYARVGKLVPQAGIVPGSAQDADITRLILLLRAGMSVGTEGALSLTALWTAVREEGQKLSRRVTQLIEEEKAERGKDELDMARAIGRMIEEVAKFVSGDDRKGWLGGCQGSREWEEMIELWVGLCRALGDVQGVDTALACLQPVVAETASSAETPLTEGMKRLDLNVQSGSSSFSIVCGRLAKLTTLLDQPEVSELAQQVGPLLEDRTAFKMAERALSELEGEELTYSIGKLSRAVDRVRYRVVKILDRAKAGQSVPEPLLQGAKAWLNNAFHLLETILLGPCSNAAYHERHADLTAVAIDAAMSLSKTCLVPLEIASRKDSLTFLKSAEALYRNSRAPSSELQDWARCLSNAAWSCGAAIYRIDLFVAASDFIELSIDLGTRALELYDSAPATSNTESEDEWQSLRTVMAQRWEALSICYMKASRKMESLEARLSCIKAHIPQLSSIKLASSRQPPALIFQLDQRFNAVLARLASTLVAEALFYCNAEQSVEDRLFAIAPTFEAVAVIAEQLVAYMQVLEYRDEVARLMQSLLRRTMDVYKAMSCPIRQVRCILKLLQHALAIGEYLVDFDHLVSAAFDLLNGLDLGVDLKLVPFKDQYLAELHMAVAANAYARRHLNLLSILSNHAEAAREALKGLVDRKRPVILSNTTNPTVRKAVPKTKSASTQPTPAQAESTSPAIDDVTGLCARLEKFIALLSLHSHDLVRIEFLRIKRGLERDEPSLLNDYLVDSVRLGTEYSRLGKVTRAGSIFNAARKVASKAVTQVLTSEQQVDFDLRYAQFLASVGNTTRSSEVYGIARQESEPESMPKGGSSTTKIKLRSATLERAALANVVLADIAFCQDNATATFRHRSTAFRLLNRAAENMARIAPKSKPVSKAGTPNQVRDDPFSAPVQQAAPEDAPPVDDAPKHLMSSQYEGKQLVGKHLSLVGDLLRSSLQLASDLLDRGSAKDALTFVNEAKHMAETAGSAYWVAKADCVLAEINIELRCFDAAAANIEQAAQILLESKGPDSAHAHLILAHLHSRQASAEEGCEMLDTAQEAFEATNQALMELEGQFSVSDHLAGTPVKGGVSTARKASISSPQNTLLPMTRTRALLEQARLLRKVGQIEESDELLEYAQNQQGMLSIADEAYVAGTTAFSKALNRFKSDLFLNSVTESTISMPVGNTDTVDESLAVGRRPISSTLHDAEVAFQRFLALRGNGGEVTDVRDAAVTIAMLRAYQASLGFNSAQFTRGAASLLDSSCAITLRREFYEALAVRKRGARVEEMVWPEVVPGPVDQTDEMLQVEESGETLDNSRSESARRSRLLEEPDMSRLPSNWCTISINVTEDHNTMFIARRQRDRAPVIFTLPLDRQGKREEEDQSFTLDTAVTELRTIIKESDDSARSAKDVDRTDKSAKMQWWSNRKVLDQRLQDLLENIEFCWLGAFKTIFNPAHGRSPKSLSIFRQTLEQTFARALAHGDKSKKPKIRLDDNIVECFSSLSSKSKDQEFEDLVYYILDLHQFNGIGVALAELDIEQLSMDVQNALTQFEQSKRAESLPLTTDEHIFLVLDRNVQEIPWESIPILRGRAVSRIPSLSFLLDRIPRAIPGGQPIDPDVWRKGIDPRRTFFILNPSGDLTKTEATFKEWAEGMVRDCQWRGIVGREPSLLEVKQALEGYDLVIYFGHGGMEQYIGTRAIRELPNCASVMIWGCSSGMMRDQGELDRVGTPYNYMVAGAPSLTAVLWDVTDAEIDKVAHSTISQLNMDERSVLKSPDELPDSAISNIQALGKARDCCKLRYLTGAAPVAYGIPIYFR